MSINSTNYTDGSINSTGYTDGSINSTDHGQYGLITLGDTTVTLASTTVTLDGLDSDNDVTLGGKLQIKSTNYS